MSAGRANGKNIPQEANGPIHPLAGLTEMVIDGLTRLGFSIGEGYHINAEGQVVKDFDPFEAVANDE